MSHEHWLTLLKQHPGNAEEYDVSTCELNEDSPLKGKRMIFLGSSVTFGACSFEQSFVEFLEAEDGIIPYKEAVSGTTLADLKDSSYIARMKTIPADFRADAFITQLSTNDATKMIPLGTIGNKDTKTVAGAIEYIIEYAQKTWKCPVIFYTGTQYDSKRYEEMIELLYEIQKVHKIGIIDLWNNPMNHIDKDTYSLYMADGIHPAKAGYRLWWTPEIRKSLIHMIG